MNIATFPPQSRVWIYQANPVFAPSDIPQLEAMLQQFAQEWVSHSRQLRAAATLQHQRFIVLMVDETRAGASGCSIDSSVRFVQQLEQRFGVQLLDRMTFAYQIGQEVHTADRATFAQLYADGTINDETLVFDNLVAHKAAFDTAWLKPLKQSWHYRMV